jgi:inner membrane protein involved in colicin E2 resistance
MTTTRPAGNASDADAPDGESEKERLTRNFNELLQELRVSQTGVQILTGFLLTVPFTKKFGSLDSFQRDGYLVTLCGAVLATALIIAPAAFHRTLFRRGEKAWVVAAADRSARAGLFALACTVSGVVWLVFDVVKDRPAGLVAGSVALVLFVLLWGVFPLTKRAED